jgi:hypothetical protein
MSQTQLHIVPIRTMLWVTQSSYSHNTPKGPSIQSTSPANWTTNVCDMKHFPHQVEGSHSKLDPAFKMPMIVTLDVAWGLQDRMKFSEIQIYILYYSMSWDIRGMHYKGHALHQEYLLISLVAIPHFNSSLDETDHVFILQKQGERKRLRIQRTIS